MNSMFFKAVLITLYVFSACVLSTPSAWAGGRQGKLAQTPPMGFNNWNSTYCREEFNEEMIRGIADKIVELGLKDAGYTYVNIDDCWANWQRDKDGNLFANPERFPSGIKALSDYIHARGLKFGIYSSAGTHTCEANEKNYGFPGAMGYEKQDAAFFASVGVDFLKYDNCNSNFVDPLKRYKAMGEALRATGRKILYAVCEWGEVKPWLWAGKPEVGASMWRTTRDIKDNFASVHRNYSINVILDEHAGPGRWNDPDMLQVGNGGMTNIEYRTHFSLWSMMAAPLLIGTDLRKIKKEDLEILLNKEVIAVNQDPLGIQARRVGSDFGIQVLVKPLKDGSIAVALYNEYDEENEADLNSTVFGLKKGKRYILRDLWKHSQVEGDGSIRVTIPAHGTQMYRITPKIQQVRL